jgi:hypothetical protein
LDKQKAPVLNAVFGGRPVIGSGALSRLANDGGQAQGDVSVGHLAFRFVFSQRAFAASRAISLMRFLVRFRARAVPPSAPIATK